MIEYVDPEIETPADMIATAEALDQLARQMKAAGATTFGEFMRMKSREQDDR